MVWGGSGEGRGPNGSGVHERGAQHAGNAAWLGRRICRTETENTGGWRLGAPMGTMPAEEGESVVPRQFTVERRLRLREPVLAMDRVQPKPRPKRAGPRFQPSRDRLERSGARGSVPRRERDQEAATEREPVFSVPVHYFTRLKQPGSGPRVLAERANSKFLRRIPPLKRLLEVSGKIIEKMKSADAITRQ